MQKKNCTESRSDCFSVSHFSSKCQEQLLPKLLNIQKDSSQLNPEKQEKIAASALQFFGFHRTDSYNNFNIKLSKLITKMDNIIIHLLQMESVITKR